MDYKYLCRPGQRSRYSNVLRAGWPGSQITVEVRFSAPIRTGPGAHPASYTMCTRSSQRVKQPHHGITTPIYCQGQIMTTAILLLPSVPAWQVMRWTLPFTVHLPKNIYIYIYMLTTINMSWNILKMNTQNLPDIKRN